MALLAAALFLGLGLGLVPRAAEAAKKPAPAVDPLRARAKELYLEAERHYMLGEHDAAIEKYKEAYRLLPDPIFLFNVGQAYRKSARPADAIAFYKNYLLASPAAANRAEVERFVADLEAELAAADADAAARAHAPPLGPESAAAAAAPPSPAALTAPAPTPAPRRSRAGVWIGVAAGALAVVGGGVALSVWFLTRGDEPWVADFRP